MRYVFTIALVLGLVASVYAQAKTSTDPADAAKIVVNVDLKSTSISQVLDAVFVGTKMSYVLPAGSQQKKLDIKLQGVTLDKAVNAIAKAVDLSATLQDGIYVFAAQTASTAVVLTGDQAAAPTTDNASLEPVSADFAAGDTSNDQIDTPNPLELFPQQPLTIGNVVITPGLRPTTVYSGGNIYQVGSVLNGGEVTQIAVPPLRVGGFKGYRQYFPNFYRPGFYLPRGP